MRNWKRIRYGVQSVLSILAVASCAAPRPAPSATSPGTTASASLPSETPSIQMSATPAGGLTSRCVERGEQLPQGARGFLVLHDNVDLSLLDVGAGHILELGSAAFGAARSADGSRVAFVDPVEDRVIAVDYKGESELLFAAGDKLDVLAWPDPDILLMERGLWEPGAQDGLNSTVAINLSTGEETELLSNYPDIFDIPVRFAWQELSNTRVAYDPSLRYAVYPAFGENAPIVLWDLEAGREVGRVPNTGDWQVGGAPRWSPDGSAFVVSALSVEQPESTSEASGTEVFLASRDGKVRRLTSLNGQMVAQERVFAWSPDGSMLAFWLFLPGKSPEVQLSLLELSSGRVTALCLGTASAAGNLRPVWSPDGQFIAATVLDPQTGRYRVIVVDSLNGTSTPVADDRYALEWIVGAD